MTPEKDLLTYISTVPFGQLDVQIRRVNRKTVEITTKTEETLKYVDNEEAKNDLAQFAQNLIDAEYTGEATIKLTLKDGKIDLISILQKKITPY